nr:hypothetical protein [Limobrevibacterium gyesilva]
MFTTLRQVPPDLPGAVAAALAAAVGPDPAPDLPALRDFALMLAHAIDANCMGMAELPYHNRHHVAEVVRAMGALCGQARADGALDPALAVLGVVAMVGHDWGHDGTPGGDGRLEKGAAARVLAAGPLSPLARQVVEAVILRTNPALVPENARRVAGDLPPGPLGAQVDLLCRLANEADVFASLLPRLGWQQAEALAHEWRGTPNGETVATFAARLSLLRTYARFSPAATRMGLASLCRRQVDAFAAVARRLGSGDCPNEGAAALDNMPRNLALTIYDDTLADTAYEGQARTA